ncbi:helix-turn-helix transcriptional regulator [Tumebacillus flagellatus]|uniref:helix-turn-helix transcriptional regulator n=1 Tax=Tumebacillus flagellatus TaxID=1157490 RepID=UPI001EE6757A|nr:helix-turn-helix transcriptional regulator [Tumebacillus flagellatus]
MRKWMIEARESKGLSREQLASEVGTTRSHIWAIENEKRTPRPELANKIACALNVDVGLFMYMRVQNGHEEQAATSA